MILAAGEALVDVVRRPDGSNTEHAGGSPANVAVGLGRLGLDVTLATSIGDDPHGELIRTHLEAHGVALANQPATRTASAVAHLGDDGSASYDFDIAWDPGRIDPPAGVTAVHTGSIGAALTPGAADIEDLVRRLAPTAVVSLDPNVRPALLPDRDEAVARLERLVALADVVKVSDEDLAWMRPGEAVEDVTAEWLAEGPAVVAVTRGSEGSTAFTAAGRLDVPSRPVAVVDTVGAGDSFTAGLVAGLHREGLLTADRRADLRGVDLDTLGRVVTLATERAAWVVGRAGA